MSNFIINPYILKPVGFDPIVDLAGRITNFYNPKIDMTVSGGDVTDIDDQLGNNDLTNNESFRRPEAGTINGYDAIAFTSAASPCWLEGASGQSHPWASESDDFWFAQTVDFDSTNGVGCMFSIDGSEADGGDSGSQRCSCYVTGTQNALYWDMGNATYHRTTYTPSGGDKPLSGTIVFIGNKTSGDQDVWFNGVKVATYASYTNTFTGAGFDPEYFRPYGGKAAHMSGVRFGCVAMGTGTLSDAEIGDLTTYMNDEHGI